MKTIYITLTIILLSLAIEVIAFKPLEFEQARRLHAKYNSISNKRDRLSFKKSLTKNYGPDLAHHISQLPYNARKLLFWGAIKETWTGFKGKVSKMFEKAKDPSQYIPPVVSATLNDVKREMTKAKHVLDTTVARINQDLMKMDAALKSSVKSYYGSIMKSVEKYRVDISLVVNYLAPQMNAKLSNYIQNIQRQAQKAGGLVVSVGKAMYKVTLVALEAAKKYVNEQLIPWLKVKVTPIWESAKKKALKILLDETGIDTNKEFSLKFDTSKFTQEKILAGLKKVTLATLEDSGIEFGKGLLKNTPFLATTIISGVVANSPICVGAVSVTIATAGAGSPAIAACAMGVITYITPPIYLQLSRLALQVALEQVPKVLGRLVEEFCPITGNGAKLICKGFTYAAEYDSDKAMGQIGGMFKRRALKGKRRRAQQVSSKRRRLSVLTASHD